MRTRLASTWPVGLGKWAGFSAPIWSNNSNSVTGYFDGDFDDQGNSNNEIPLLSGGTAVRIQHLRKVGDNKFSKQVSTKFQNPIPKICTVKSSLRQRMFKHAFIFHFPEK